MTDDYTRDARYYRYSQMATAYTFCKAMDEAGIELEQMLDVNWIANTDWVALIDEYEKVIKETPANTRDQLADLLFRDLLITFEKFTEDLDIPGDDGA